MPKLNNYVTAQLTASITVVTTTETLILVAPQIQALTMPSTYVVIVDTIVLIGASTTSLEVNLYRGVFGAGGVLVLNTVTQGSVVAARHSESSPIYSETLLAQNAVTYSLTVFCAGATANSTVQTGNITVFAN